MNKISKLSPGKLVISMACLLGLPLVAQAQYVYKRVDSTGKIIYSDNIPANTKERFEIYSAKSLTLQKVQERELSQDEYYMAEQKKKEEEKVKLAQQEQDKKDQALVSTYNTIEDISRMKAFELGQLDNAIKNDIEMLARLNDTNTILSDQIVKTKDSTSSRLLADRILKNEKDISVLKTNIERNRQLYVAKENKYKQDRERFEEIAKKKVVAETVTAKP